MLLFRIDFVLVRMFFIGFIPGAFEDYLWISNLCSIKNRNRTENWFSLNLHQEKIENKYTKSKKPTVF